MFKECPNCQGRMVALSHENFCLSCGKSFPLSTGKPLQEDSSTPQHTHIPEPHSSFDPIPTPDRTPLSGPSDVHDDGDFTPQPIINHHATSYARRRLDAQIADLEAQPELESGIDPEEELEAPHTAYAGLISDDESRHQDQQHDSAEESPSEDLPAQKESDTTNEDIKEDSAEELEKPIKQSAYVVSATQPLGTSQASIPPLTEGLSPEEQLLRDARALASEKPTDSAHSKADEILAAAATPEKTSRSSRSWILIVISICMVGGSILGAWYLLRPASSPASKTPTPSSTVQPTATPSLDPAKRDSQRKSDLNSIAIGLEAYHKATGAYPVGSDISILSPLEKTTPPFITKVNVDPSSTESVVIKYAYVSDGSGFTLSATLEKSQDADAKDGLYVVRNKNQ